ncbi:hypothetical protein PTNB29_06215 [Pyrenophora teres f. teres]|nr:hypothetical protein PTNB29_06215 [Pyrenophora teres f. teres]
MFRPATFCLTATTAKDDEDPMSAASVVFFRKGHNESEPDMIQIETFYCIPMAPKLLKRIEFNAQPHSSSPRILLLAKKWFKSCKLHHTSCREMPKPKWYPKRLLEVHPEKRNPRLILTADHANLTEYASLSHCWGLKPFVKLLSKDYTKFLREISFDELPKTFQDALSICKSLGLGYIWIDSFCIVRHQASMSIRRSLAFADQTQQIQDDANDWKAESVQMNKVYRNSTLTLSASGAEDATQGLYFPRDPSLITPLPLCPPFQNFSWHNNCHQQSTKTPAPPTWHLLHDHFFGDILQDTPIFRRAWIFQERLLSPRILHFGTDQVFWECRTSNACETFPDGLPNCLTAPSRFLQKHAYESLQSGSITPSIESKRLRGITNRPAAEQMAMIWQALVTDYTKGRLTLLSDKLIAIAGMAQDVRNVWGPRIQQELQYVAGMWSSHLPEALLWEASENAGMPPSRAMPWRAPTWSWASVEGIVTWEQEVWRYAYTCVTKVLEVDVKCKGDVWGAVEEGRVVVRGPVRKVRRWETSPYDVWLGVEKDDLTPEPEPSSLSNNGGVLMLPDEGPYRRSETWGESLYALLVVRFHDPAVSGRCVVLLNAVPGLPNTFHRVGVTALMNSAQIAEWFDNASLRTITFI